MDEIEKTIQFSQSKMKSLSILLLKEKPDTISYIFEAYELLRSLSLVVIINKSNQVRKQSGALMPYGLFSQIQSIANILFSLTPPQ